tara:strand:+ start:38 stop:406 length:369 start_codon:yes stop_codon:yes gene_type:complete
MSLPKNTASCIQYLFPDSIPDTDWSVATSGDGKTEISKWNNSIGEKPTESELIAIKNEADKAELFNGIRKKRNNLLYQTDWMAGSDAPKMSAKWLRYRQDLRDLPASNTDPKKIVFPIKPKK